MPLLHFAPRENREARESCMPKREQTSLYVKLGGNALTGATLCKDDSPILHLIDLKVSFLQHLYPQSCNKSQQNSAKLVLIL